MAGNKTTGKANTGAAKRKPAPVNRPRSREKRVTGSSHFPEIYPIDATNKMTEQMNKTTNFPVTKNPNAARDQRRWDATVTSRHIKSQASYARKGKKKR